MKLGRYWMVVGLAVASVAASASADLRLPKLFSDHMMLQRELAAPVWGWANPGETITVKIAGQSLTATADKAGRWQVKLAPLKADGASLEMTVSAKTTNTVVHDILVGDVWLCSGQSNMEFDMGRSDNAKDVMPTATNTMIRLLTVKPGQAGQPVTDIQRFVAGEEAMRGSDKPKQAATQQ